jgi:hypothetical protein
VKERREERRSFSLIPQTCWTSHSSHWSCVVLKHEIQMLQIGTCHKYDTQWISNPYYKTKKTGRREGGVSVVMFHTADALKLYLHM